MATRNISIRLTLEEHQAVRAALQALGDQGDRALKRIEGAALPASRGLLAVNAVSRDGQAIMQGYAGRLGVAGSALSAIGPAGLVAAAALGAVGVAALKAFSISREAAEFTNGLQDSAEALILTTDALQLFRAQAEAGGLKTEQFDKALDRFNRTVADARTGGDQAANAVRRLGLELSGTGPEANTARFREFVDALKAIPDPAERSTLAVAFLGKEVAGKFLAAFKDGTAAMDAFAREARALGLVLDRDLIARGAETQRQYELLARAIDLQLKRAFVDLAPTINDAVRLFLRGASAVREFFDSLKSPENRGADTLRKDLTALAADIRTLEEQIAARRRVGNEAAEKSADALTKLLAEKRAEALRLKALIAGKEAAEIEGGFTLPAPRTADQGIGFDKDKVAGQVRELLAARDAQQRLAEATGQGEAAVRAATLANQEADRLRKLGLHDRDEEVRQLARLKGITEEEARAINLNNLSKKEARDLIGALTAGEENLANAIAVRKRAEATEQRFNPESGFRERKRLLDEEYATGLVSARAYHENLRQLEDQRLEASRNATDGILLGLRRVEHEAGNAGRHASDAIVSGFRRAEDAAISLTFRTASLKDALRNLALGGLEDAARAGFRSGSSNVAGFLSDTFAGLFHEGGVVGAGGGRGRLVASSVFAFAPRHHDGYTPGIGPGERPAVLQVGEEVLTARDPRHARNFRPGNSYVYNIDARGAAPGVGEEIAAALRATEDRAVNRSVNIMQDTLNRDGHLGGGLSGR